PPVRDGARNAYVATGALDAAEDVHPPARRRVARLRHLRPAGPAKLARRAGTGDRCGLHEAELRAGRVGRAPACDGRAGVAAPGLRLPVTGAPERAGRPHE